jgi:uncharacterized protein YdaU (DUF1376 family)
MPFGLIAFHPRAGWLPQAAFGMLTRLAWYYWSTEKPLPRSDAAINALLAVHRPTWSAHKAEIWAILADIIPELQRQRDIKREARARLQIAADISNAKRKASLNERRRHEALEKSARAITLPERTQTQTRINVERRTKRQNQNVFVETHL